MGLTTDDGDSSDSDTQMAECGACRSEIPIDSTSCPDCGVSFSGVADDDMGECGACGTLLPMDSKSCPQCGVVFVLDDLTTALSVWMKDEGMTISELFAQVDSDNDQSLTADEVKNALEGRNLAFLGANELDRFISQIDLNDDGVISFAELAAALSMPWSPPEEKVVLEPEDTEVESEEVTISEEQDSDDDDDEEEDGSDDEEDDSDDDDGEEDDSDDDDEEEDDSDDDDEEEDDSDDDDEQEDDSDDDDEQEDDSDDHDEEDDDSDEDSDSTDDDWEETETPEEQKSDRPAEWQRFLMRNYENIFPILYTIGALFVGIWLVNAGGIIVDGSGGNIAFDGDMAQYYDSTGDSLNDAQVQPGEIYPCDKSIQESGCKNSLTPFAGENGASSMPAGFYWDGIMFIILGLAGIGGIAYLQMQTKQMRAEYRRKKSEEDTDSSSDTEQGEDADDTDNDDESEEEESDDDQETEGEESDDEESDDEESDDEESDDEDSDDDDGDGIEIGSRVGVEDKDGDWYGEVVEFDDEEDAVVVKREDDGEEYLVDWDSLFQDD